MKLPFGAARVLFLALIAHYPYVSKYVELTTVFRRNVVFFYGGLVWGKRKTAFTPEDPNEKAVDLFKYEKRLLHRAVRGFARNSGTACAPLLFRATNRASRVREKPLTDEINARDDDGGDGSDHDDLHGFHT
ncbi:MAG: hypothetical protein IJM30_02590, partial [Thermoguttaceae bacterium]|nr:hypothetical protein [Thermoguttaceae bacterium]